MKITRKTRNMKENDETHKLATSSVANAHTHTHTPTPTTTRTEPTHMNTSLSRSDPCANHKHPRNKPSKHETRAHAQRAKHTTYTTNTTFTTTTTTTTTSAQTC